MQSNGPEKRSQHGYIRITRQHLLDPRPNPRPLTSVLPAAARNAITAIVSGGVVERRQDARRPPPQEQPQQLALLPQSDQAAGGDGRFAELEAIRLAQVQCYKLCLVTTCYVMLCFNQSGACSHYATSNETIL